MIKLGDCDIQSFVVENRLTHSGINQSFDLKMLFYALAITNRSPIKGFLWQRVPVIAAGCRIVTVMIDSGFD